jgi:hypothetical protein
MRSFAVGLSALFLCVACSSSSVNDSANTGGNANGGSGGSSGGSGGVAGASAGGSGGSSGGGTGGSVSCAGAGGEGPIDALGLAFAGEDDFDKGGMASAIVPITLGDCASAVAIAEPEQKQIAILRVAGAAFAAPELVGSGVDLVSVAAGDLDNDGIADLIALERGANPGLVTFKGATSGSFGSPKHTTLDFDPDVGGTLAVGKLDGDGFVDVVVASQSSEQLQIMLGIGTGGFSEGAHYSGLGQPVFIGIADLDRKTGKDLFFITPSSLVLLLANGDGTFDPQPAHPIEDTDQAVGAVVGDFNGDQRDDLAIAFGGAVGRVRTFASGGGGGFFDGEPQAVGAYPGPPIAADFDRDGVLDVAVGHETTQSVSVVLGTGDGNFISSASFPTTLGTGPKLLLPFRIEPEHRPSILIAYTGSVNLGRLANMSSKN